MKRGTRADTRGVRQADAMTDYGIDNVLEIPNFGDSDQYVYRYIRVKMGAEDDVNNINQRLRQGWRFVKEEDIPEEIRTQYVLPVVKSGLALLNGVVQVGDLAMAKIPRERAEALQGLVEAATARQMDAVNSRLVEFEDGGGNRHTLRNDSKSRTRVGRHAHLDM